VTSKLHDYDTVLPEQICVLDSKQFASRAASTKKNILTKNIDGRDQDLRKGRGVGTRGHRLGKVVVGERGI
jgi:hypothetical protein